MEAGNDMEQSVALVAAANKVVQDPSSVGSALRTISLRLRGTSVKILEEMGEETDGVTQSISKLQGKIEALSGVDILTESGGYKDTYTILKEIGEVWEDMSDIDQAALLELMAGKNRANTLAAILGNMEDLEGAYESALNADGSALKENATYLDSVQGRIDLFNNSLQTMWMNFLNSDALKTIIDMGTAAVKLVDTLGLLPTLLGAVSAIFASKAFIKVGPLNELVEATKAIQQNTAAKETNTAATAAGTAASEASEQQTRQEAAAEIEKAQSEIAGTAAKEANNIATAESAVVGEVNEQQNIQETITEDAHTDALRRNTQEQNSNNISKKSGGSGFLSKAGNVLGGLLKGFAVGAAVSVVTSLIGSWVNAAAEAAKRMEQLREEAIASANQLDETRKSTENYKEEIEDLRKTLSDSTSTEKEAYDARAKLLEIEDQLIDKFGLEAKGINLVTGEIESQIDAINRLNQASAQEWYNTNQEAYQNAIGTVEKKHDYNDLKIYSETKTTTGWDEIITHSFGSYSDQFYKEYVDGITKIIEKYGGSVSPHDIYDDDPDNGTTNTTTEYLATIKGKTAEEMDAIFEEIQNYITQFEFEHGDVDLSSEIIKYEKIRKMYITEDYTKQKELYDQGRLNEAYANYTAEYSKIMDSQERFLAASTDEDRLAALSDYANSVEAAFEAAGGEVVEGELEIDPDSANAHMQRFFLEMHDKFESEEFQLRVTVNENDLKTKITNILSSGGEVGLSALDDNQMKDLLDKYETGEFNAGPDGTSVDYSVYTKEQVDGIAKLKVIADEAGITVEELIDSLVALGMVKGDPGDSNDVIEAKGQAYSTLATAIEKYSNALSAANEVVYDNVELSEEQYNAIVELVGSETELAKCIDKTNGYIVTNADKLKELVDLSKDKAAQNVKEAKAQARLKYYQLYKEINKLVGGKKVENEITRKQIKSRYEEMAAVQKTIAQYSLLEAKLLGAVNAYTKFETAQSIDSDNDYGSKAEEMVSALGEAFTTLELGTETAQAAIEGLIPEEVFEDADTLDAKMQKIYEYFTGGPVSKLFTIEFDDDGGISSVEMTKENVEEFTKGLINQDFSFVNEDGETITGSGIFQGSWDKFTLNPAITSLEDFAEACHMTEEVAFAFLTSLEKYDISWLGGDNETLLDQLMGDDLDYALQKATQKMAEAEKKVASGKLSTGDQEYIDAQNELSALGDQAINDAIAWADTNKHIDIVKENIKDLNKQYENATDEDIKNGISKELERQQKNLDTLLGMLAELDEPSEFTLQFASDKLDEEIESLKKDIETTFPTIDLSKAIVFDEEKQEYVIDYTFVSDHSAEKLEEYVGYLNQQYTIDAMMGDEVPTVLDVLQEIKTILEQTYTLQVETNVDDAPVQDFVTWLNNTPFTKTVKFFAQKLFGSSDEGSEASDVNGTANVSGTAFKNGSWGAPKTETALTGELGPELLVRGNRWTTVGENGAEFTQVKKGDIIFNHKQTESLLKNGRITSRGKAYAGGTTKKSGTAYAYTILDNLNGVKTKDAIDIASGMKAVKNAIESTTKAIIAQQKKYVPIAVDVDTYSGPANLPVDYGNQDGDSGGSGSDEAEEFEEVFDWVAVRLEEINEELDYMNAQLENAVGIVNKNNIIDNMLDTNEIKLKAMQEGLKKYSEYAAKLLEKVPDEYKDAVQNGMIDITEFTDEADEETVEAINNYREWAQKAADLRQQIEELESTIADLAKQKFDNIVEEFDNVISLIENANEKLDAQISLMEDRGYVASTKYYESMMENAKKRQDELQKEREALQAMLDEQVKLGNIKVGSDAWYEMVNQLYEVDAAIVECTSDLESYQNAINDIYWDNFDQLINRLEYLKEETQGLIDIMGNGDMVVTPETEDGWSSDEVQWTDEGLASLGLYAQQMEIAEYQARQYAEAIEDLNKDYADGKYSEDEYLEKLNELQSAQYDSINAYYEAQEAIKELNEARIDAIKEGIEKEIKAYEELIEKKKEELDAEKDLYDFQKSTMEQQKNIADIQRKIAALSGDNSASAVAKRKQLAAELAEAEAGLEESYYDRSIEKRQEALDKELEDFQDEKDREVEKWEEYLEDIEQIVADSLVVVKDNATIIYDTLNAKAEEYDLTLSDAIMTPWQDGAIAVSDYQTVFDTAMSSTMDQLEAIKNKWLEIIDEMQRAAGIEIGNQEKTNNEYTSATETPEPQKPSNNETNKEPTNNISIGGKINAGSARIYANSSGAGGGKQYFASDPIYVVLDEQNGFLKVRHHKLSSGATGWFKKSDVKAYAKGTIKTYKDEIALIDELGPELQLVPNGNGRLEYIKKGTSIIPADMTERLMNLAMDPQTMLDQNRPQIGLHPEIRNTEIHIDNSVGELIHIDNCSTETLPDVKKIVNEALEQHTRRLNQSIRKYTR